MPSVIIYGGSVIGACVDFYLAERGANVTAVKRAGSANGASGRSGGFLALYWYQGTPVDPLARQSFDLHVNLSERVGTDWGSRRVQTLGIAASSRRNLSRLRSAQAPDWLRPHAAAHNQLGTPETTAQVTPEFFTKGMLKASGTEMIEGAVEGVIMEGERTIGVLVDGKPLTADPTVIAMDPWSLLACQWLPSVCGLKDHSLVFRYTPDDPKALFVELEDEYGEVSPPKSCRAQTVRLLSAAFPVKRRYPSTRPT
jgi:glycine/D-amino acid oxidase-like deaminating enzyme